MSELEKQLEKHGIPKRIQVTCDECGKELLDTKKEEPIEFVPSYIAAEIEIRAKKHRDDASHASITVDVEKRPVAKDELNVTVNVNE
jgi:hypothetical protein